MTGYDVNK